MGFSLRKDTRRSHEKVIEADTPENHTRKRERTQTDPGTSFYGLHFTFYVFFFGFGVYGFGFGDLGLGFRVWGLGLGVWGLGFRFWDLSFRV